jgi:hypothetical protein
VFSLHLDGNEQRRILLGHVHHVPVALGGGRRLTRVGCPIAAFVTPGPASFPAPAHTPRCNRTSAAGGMAVHGGRLHGLIAEQSGRFLREPQGAEVSTPWRRPEGIPGASVHPHLGQHEIAQV